jgi:hypothetical protein
MLGKLRNKTLSKGFNWPSQLVRLRSETSGNDRLRALSWQQAHRADSLNILYIPRSPQVSRSCVIRTGRRCPHRSAAAVRRTQPGKCHPSAPLLLAGSLLRGPLLGGPRSSRRVSASISPSAPRTPSISPSSCSADQNRINVEIFGYVESFRDRSTQNPPRSANPPHYPTHAERRHLSPHQTAWRVSFAAPSAT